MRSKCSVSLLLLSQLAGWASAQSSGEDNCDVHTRLLELSPGELGFSVNAESTNHLHLTCYAMGENQEIKQKTVTEFMRASVGVGELHPDPNFNYPCPGQNGWGDTLLEVMEVNGYDAYNLGAQSITTSESTCDSDVGYFDGRVHVTQVVNEHLTIDTHVFKNAAAQAAANLQNTMTIGTLDKCKMELIYAFKPNTGGGLNARVEVRRHGFGQDGNEDIENRLREAMQTTTNHDENKLSIYLPKALLLESIGLGPDGCGASEESSGEEGSGEGTMYHLIDVSLSLTCGATGERVDATFTFQDSHLQLSLTPSQAPESCNVLYWDPLITPFESSTAGVALQQPGGDDDDECEGFCLVITFRASGEVSDYASQAVQDSILTVLAQAAGLDEAPSGASLDVTAGSVNMEATLPLASSAAAEAASATFAAAVGSMTDLNGLMEAAGIDITIESEPSIDIGGDGGEDDGGEDVPSPTTAVVGSVVGVLVLFGGLAYRKHHIASQSAVKVGEQNV